MNENQFVRMMIVSILIGSMIGILGAMLLTVLISLVARIL